MAAPFVCRGRLTPFPSPHDPLAESSSAGVRSQRGAPIWSLTRAEFPGEGNTALIAGSVDGDIRVCPLEVAPALSTLPNDPKAAEEENGGSHKEADGQEESRLSHALGVTRICVAEREDRSPIVATGCLDSHIRLFEATTSDSGTPGDIRQPSLNMLRSWKTSVLESFDVQFVPGTAGSRLASCGQSGHVSVWDLVDDQAAGANSSSDTDGSSPRLLSDLSCCETFATCLAFSPTGTSLAVGSEAGLIAVVDMISGKRSSSINTHSSSIRTITVSPQDPNLIIAGGDDSFISLHDLRTAKRISLLVAHTAPVLGSSVSPNARVLATSSMDHSVRIWDIGQRQSLHAFAEHEEQVSCVTWYNDTLLASGGDDGQIIWFKCTTH